MLEPKLTALKELRHITSHYFEDIHSFITLSAAECYFV